MGTPLPTEVNSPFSFVFLTDTHIMANGLYRPRNGAWVFDTAKSLSQVVNAILSLETAPAFVIVGGDLVSPDVLERERTLPSKDYEPSYRLLSRLLEPIPCPVHMLLGNHDNRLAFKHVVQKEQPPDPTPHAYSFDYHGHHFVLLDSLVIGETVGRLGEQQQSWLEHDLHHHRHLSTMVFVHHQPWPVGHAMDKIALENGERLMDSLTAHPQVRWVFCGHVHMDHHIEQNGLTLVSTPSTCFQVNKSSDKFGWVPGPPAFRLVHVGGERIATRVIQLPDQEFVPHII